ncbi:hypothetical protein [Streptomyces finlayi]|uniref:hypothetical protein n=1 Tax=Streptomyces finlayi TaxID=67296 RepID=UPI0027E4415F|nr:hypothetical protein [Streptomyces finlayi]
MGRDIAATSAADWSPASSRAYQVTARPVPPFTFVTAMVAASTTSTIQDTGRQTGQPGSPMRGSGSVGPVHMPPYTVRGSFRTAAVSRFPLPAPAPAPAPAPVSFT